MRLQPLVIASLSLALIALVRHPAEAQTPPAPIRLLSYSGIFQDNYSDVVTRSFTAETGIPVQYVGGDTSASMLGQLRTQKGDPQLDVVIMDTTTASIACAEGLVEPVSAARLPVINTLFEQAQKSGGDCGPGVTFDHLVIVYDSKVVTPPPTSLRVLWNPAWRGKIGISAPPNIQGLALTAILAYADTADWKNAAGAFRELKALAPSVQTFEPQPDGYTLVLNDTLVFATGWNARAQLYRDRSGGRLGVMLPSEGTVFQINTINVVKNARHADAAFRFMAHALAAPTQAAFTERMFYAPTNAGAQIDENVASRTAASPFNMAKVIPLDWSEMIRLRDVWNQRWRREVIAASGR